MTDNTPSNTAKSRLKTIETRLTQIVASVHGIVTLDEVEMRDNLRAQVGAQWDAVNQTWAPL